MSEGTGPPGQGYTKSWGDMWEREQVCPKIYPRHGLRTDALAPPAPGAILTPPALRRARAERRNLPWVAGGQLGQRRGFERAPPRPQTTSASPHRSLPNSA